VETHPTEEDPMTARVRRRPGGLALSIATVAVALAIPASASATVKRDDFKRDCEANGGTFVETKDEHGNTVYRCRTNQYTEDCTNTGNGGHVCIRKWRTQVYDGSTSGGGVTTLPRPTSVAQYPYSTTVAYRAPAPRS
jgi:hypothetical protein